MQDLGKQTSPVEKARDRARITEQVEAFLQAGGKIDVLDNRSTEVRARAANNWHDEVEFMQLSE
ncbi:MAG: hypothetical protein KDI04_05820 [Halieaceae bacterium]|nr:hypothetical protein [Halieaceae bacterium]MCP5147860.1 hypothetical protein [Pseudomonadales bacterium]MCP5167693.1 hypothetical protein [Pseudomonadales bacterium]MCP5187479.1 hypothetical protein [Pseudomonadales bacterium]